MSFGTYNQRGSYNQRGTYPSRGRGSFVPYKGNEFLDSPNSANSNERQRMGSSSAIQSAEVSHANLRGNAKGSSARGSSRCKSYVPLSGSLINNKVEAKVNDQAKVDDQVEVKDRSITPCKSSSGCVDTPHSVQSQHSSQRDDYALREGLWFARNEGLFGKCYFQVGDEKVLIAKEVLAAQSDTLKKKFLKGHETSDMRILIDSSSIDAIEALVKFLYLAKVDDLEKNGEELFHLAVKYQIKNLQSVCSHHLGTTLTEDNVCTRLIDAVLHDDEHLMAAAVNHISSNSESFTAVFNSDKWFAFANQHKELAKKVNVVVSKKIFAR